MMWPAKRLEIEDVAQEALFLTLPVMLVRMMGIRAMIRLTLRGLRRLSRRLRRALEDLVELAAVEPYATTLRAIVYLDPGALAHLKF